MHLRVEGSHDVIGRIRPGFAQQIGSGAVEDSLYRHHRAHSKGWAGQQVDTLGLAGLINALTRERMRKQLLSQAA